MIFTILWMFFVLFLLCNNALSLSLPYIYTLLYTSLFVLFLSPLSLFSFFNNCNSPNFVPFFCITIINMMKFDIFHWQKFPSSCDSDQIVQLWCIYALKSSHVMPFFKQSRVLGKYPFPLPFYFFPLILIMSVVNLQTKDVLSLVSGDSVILGRHICGIESKYVSHKHGWFSIQTRMFFMVAVTNWQLIYAHI